MEFNETERRKTIEKEKPGTPKTGSLKDQQNWQTFSKCPRREKN